MTTKQELTIHGVKVLRPEPTNPDSLRCHLGFHDIIQFDPILFDGMTFIYNQYPEFCSRCNHYSVGLKIPPRPKMPIPKIKPAKVDRDLSIEHAKELLQANGYVVYLVSDRGSYAGASKVHTVKAESSLTEESLDRALENIARFKHPHSENTKPADAAKFASHAPITGGHQPNSKKEPTPPGDE